MSTKANTWKVRNTGGVPRPAFLSAHVPGGADAHSERWDAQRDCDDDDDGLCCFTGETGECRRAGAEARRGRAEASAGSLRHERLIAGPPPGPRVPRTRPAPPLPANV